MNATLRAFIDGANGTAVRTIRDRLRRSDFPLIQASLGAIPDAHGGSAVGSVTAARTYAMSQWKEQAVLCIYSSGK